MLRLKKKGQITSFIIIGLILLISAALIFYSQQYSVETKGSSEVKKSLVLIKNTGDIKESIEVCIGLLAKPLIFELASNGGLRSLSEFAVFQGRNYSYYCHQSENGGCVNNLISRSKLETELNAYITSELSACLDFSSFEAEGFSVVIGDFTVSSIIGADKTIITLAMPLDIANLDFKQHYDVFNKELNVEFGLLFDLALSITNQEIQSGFFDETLWMVNNGASVKIFKHKPYPDTVYSLAKINLKTSEKLIFNFAIGGVDSILDYVKSSKAIVLEGFCMVRSDCYSNVGETDCDGLGGKFSADSPLACNSEVLIEGCTGAECEDCLDISHGQSFCLYDGPVGQGLDFVGSRHYKQSCINGRLYTTECEDFRQELCTQVNSSYATCRPNRWEDCVIQENKGACENSRVRDCEWGDFLVKSTPLPLVPPKGESSRSLSNLPDYDSSRCYPEVPPGFRFWENQGNDMCAQANELFDCDGVSCPEVWVDSTSVYCRSLGDCGAAKNVQGLVSTSGQFRSDGLFSDVYFLPFENLSYWRSLTLEDRRGTAGRDGNFKKERNELSFVNGKVKEFMNTAMGWTFEDAVEHYIDEELFHGEGHFHVWGRHMSTCSAWDAIEVESCDFCVFDKRKPCTEYRCKSLGSNCEYSESEGFGSCTFTSDLDDQAPEISVISVSKESAGVVQELNFSSDFFVLLDGVKVKNKLEPFDKLKISLLTDEPAVCYFEEVPFFMLGDLFQSTANIFSSSKQAIAVQQEFKTVHELEFIVPNLILIKEYLLDMLKAPSVLTLAYPENINKLLNFSTSIFGQYLELAGISKEDDEAFNLFEDVGEFYFDLYREQAVSLSSYMNQLIASTELFDFNLFITCIDIKGNKNENDFFVGLKLTQDTKPPVIGNISVKEVLKKTIYSISFDINEPVKCRFDSRDVNFEDMILELTCDDFDYFPKSEYECSGNVLTAFSGEVFVECIDYKNLFDSYFFTVKNDSSNVNESGFIDLIDSEFGSFFGSSSIISVRSLFLRSNDTVFNSRTNSNLLSIKFTEDNICRQSSIKSQNYFYVMKNSTQKECVAFDFCSFDVSLGFGDVLTPYSFSCSKHELRPVNSTRFSLTLY